MAGAQKVLHIPQRRPAVDDVLDDDDVPALDGCTQVGDQPHLTRRRRPAGIAGDGQEVDRHVVPGARDLADQVGQEDRCAFESGDQMEAGGEVAAEIARQFRDPLLNLLLRE